MISYSFQAKSIDIKEPYCIVLVHVSYISTYCKTNEFTVPITINMIYLHHSSITTLSQQIVPHSYHYLIYYLYPDRVYISHALINPFILLALDGVKHKLVYRIILHILACITNLIHLIIPISVIKHSTIALGPANWKWLELGGFQNK